MITSGRDLCGWLSSPQPKRPNWRAQTYFFWFSLSFPENAGTLRLRHRSESGETAAQPQPPQAMSRCSPRLILFSFPVPFRRNFVSSLSTHADPIHISCHFVIAVRRCEERAKRKTEDGGRRGDVGGWGGAFQSGPLVRGLFWWNVWMQDDPVCEATQDHRM